MREFKPGDQVRVWAENYGPHLLSILGDKGEVVDVDSMITVRFDEKHVGDENSRARVCPQQLRRLKPKAKWVKKKMWMPVSASPNLNIHATSCRLFQSHKEALQSAPTLFLGDGKGDGGVIGAVAVTVYLKPEGGK